MSDSTKKGGPHDRPNTDIPEDKDKFIKWIINDGKPKLFNVRSANQCIEEAKKQPIPKKIINPKKIISPLVDPYYNQYFDNPMYSVMKEYVMIIVEKNEDKIAIKFFQGYKHRREGKPWFKVEKKKNSENIKDHYYDMADSWVIAQAGFLQTKK
jgi:hypothetical protein